MNDLDTRYPNDALNRGRRVDSNRVHGACRPDAAKLKNLVASKNPRGELRLNRKKNRSIHLLR